MIYTGDFMKRYVIFDMDGVLVDTEPLHFQVWKQIFSERGLEIDHEHYKDCIGSTNQFLMELILKNYGRDFRNDPSMLTRFMEIKDQYVKEKGFPKIEGAAEAVLGLHRMGYKMAVASSSPVRYIHLAMENLGIKSCFSVRLAPIARKTFCHATSVQPYGSDSVSLFFHPRLAHEDEIALFITFAPRSFPT